MTAEQARQRLLTWAAYEVGYREGANNWTKYAAMPAVTELLGWDAQGQPWCNTFVDAGFVCMFGLELGAAMIGQPVGGGSVLCSASAEFFREAGSWNDRTYIPEPGDVVFFLVGGEINHMGIVAGVDRGTIHTIEGNSSDRVAERSYPLNDPGIAGYGRPLWGLAANVHDSGKDAGSGKDIDVPVKEDEAPAETEIPVSGLIAELPTLRVGMGGAWVAALQGILSSQGYNLGPCGVDGDFGVCTLSCVRQFQARHKLTVDGVVGPMTWECMLKA